MTPLSLLLTAALRTATWLHTCLLLLQSTETCMEFANIATLVLAETSGRLLLVTVSVDLDGLHGPEKIFTA